MNNFVKFSKFFSRFSPNLVIFASEIFWDDFQRLLDYFQKLLHFRYYLLYSFVAYIRFTSFPNVI